jgi:SAM-dependent methyltransferase
MGTFSAEWLRLREPVDHAARSAALTGDVLRALPRGPIGILDLACGTGSNLRYLRDRISNPDWLLVDHDPSLLTLVAPAPNLRTVERDLRELDDGLFAGRALVTASALLDLVSESWLRQLVSRCRAHDAAALFALTYDGRLSFEPAEPDDALICDLVNRHQRTDKGFGPALGPSAVAAAADLFRAGGFDVRIAASDWALRRTSVPDPLQEQLIDGWAEAAEEMAPDRAGTIEAWRRKRRSYVASGQSGLTVGHQDLAALPA